MSEAVVTQEPPTPDPAPVLSITDHAKQFGVADRKEPDPTTDADVTTEVATEPAEPLRVPHPSDQQKRDDGGKFTGDRKRPRTKELVGQVHRLTGRAKTAEEQYVALKQEFDAFKARHEATAQTPTVAAGDDPEPTETDPKYAGDPMKFLSEHARWSARDEYRQQRAKDDAAATKAKADASAKESGMAWAGRMKSAESRYPDFTQTVNVDAPWIDKATQKAHPAAVALDSWIMQDEQGPDVLYYFLKNPQEVDALLRMPMLQQLRSLAMLSQQFASNDDERGGDTGSPAVAAKSSFVPPPKPPNPVRTEAQRTSDAPPKDGSLSITKHAKTWRYK